MPKKEKVTTIAIYNVPERIRSIVVRHRKSQVKNDPVEKIEIFTLQKSEQNPIINPNPDNWWENAQVFNPGVIVLNDEIHIIYRSIGNDGISRFGYAHSPDGVNVARRINYPVYEHITADSESPYVYYYTPSGGSWGGCEDPRLVRVGDEDTIYMTYTACDGGLRVGLSSIKVDDFLAGKWNWSMPSLISPKGQIHKNWVIFPEKINGKYAILHSIAPKLNIEYRDSLEFEEEDTIPSSYKNDDTRKGCWDSWIRGAGPPPIKTKYGWLIFYHGMDRNNPVAYKVGAFLTDLNDPTKILYRTKNPILEPSESYENNGFKSGVVYASGAVVRDGKLYIYYGGSDSYICVAYCELDEFLKDLMREEKPKLISKKITKTKKI